MSGALPTIKFVAKVATTIGVGHTIGNIIKNNTTPENGAETAQIFVGSYVLGAMITHHAVNHVESQVDQVATWYKNRKKTDETPVEEVA